MEKNGRSAQERHDRKLRIVTNPSPKNQFIVDFDPDLPQRVART